MSPGGPVEPLKMTWTASGTVGDCTVKGKTTVTFPTGVDPSQDLTRPSYGQLNVIGPGGGNFHSVMVKAFNPEAKLIMTCPGDPPTVTEEFFEAGYLLHIVWEKNILCDEYLEFWGERSFDLNDPLFAVLLSIPPGPNRSIAIEALQMGGAERNPTHSYYEWSWGLWPGGVMPPENIRQNCRPAP